MLILSRNEGESVTLILPNGDKVEMTHTEYCGKQTKVGIDAPSDVIIWRSELLPKHQTQT